MSTIAGAPETIGDSLPFERLPNFRDVASSIGAFSRGRPFNMKQGKLFRSARPDEATPRDRKQLVYIWGVKTIMDLRTDSEHVEQARKLSSKKISTVPGETPSDPIAPVKILDMQYEEINFNGFAYSCALIKQLSYWNAAKLVVLYAVGLRNQAISILGTNVMAKRGLVGLAEDSLTHCTAEVKQVFDVLADEKAYPIMVHCTQGKDRTGLVVLLVAMLMGASLEAVKEDYLLSQVELRSEREARVEEINKIGLPDSFADCSPEWPEKVWGFVEEQYGGVEAYLDRCGVDQRQRDRVKQLLASDR